MELYDAEFRQRREKKPEVEEVTCPVCGTKHSPLIGCPQCALNGCYRPPRSEEAKPEKPRRKPPWEK